MEKDVDHVGTGDSRLDNEEATTGAYMPDTPGYVAEASQRHREYPEAEIPEIRSTQLVPGPLDEHEEPSVHFEIENWRNKTHHQSK